MHAFPGNCTHDLGITKTPLVLFNSPFLSLSFLVTLSHTLVLGNFLFVPSVYKLRFLFFFLSFSSLFAVLVIYPISPLSCSLFGHLLKAEIDFCQDCSDITVLRQYKYTIIAAWANCTGPERYCVCLCGCGT